jgi:hypothetical protein
MRSRHELLPDLPHSLADTAKMPQIAALAIAAIEDDLKRD